MSETPETPADRRRRNRAILAARGAKLPWKTVASAFGLSVAQARKAAKSAEEISTEESAFADLNPDATLRRIVDVQTSALETVEKLMEDADNSNARVGACRAAGSVGSDLRDSLAAAGVIPGRVVADSGAILRVREEVRAAVAALMGAAEDEGIDLSPLLARAFPATVTQPALKGAA
jgi:hypothetical protein